MRKLLLIFFFLPLGIIFGQKTYVMHYLPILTESQAKSYIGYDAIVVDHEVIHTSAGQLKMLKRINPKLKILVYSEKMQWHRPMFPDKPWSLWMTKTLEKYPKWFLLSPTGKNLVFWPGTVMMDCRLNGFKYTIDGKKYSYIEYFTDRYIKDVIMAYKNNAIKLDGVLDDDLFKDIHFLEGGVDANRDGLEDEASELNRQWRLGNAYFLKEVRKTMGSDFLIIGNGGHGYYMDVCQGKQMENFPEIYIGNWGNNMSHAAGMKIAFFNAREDNWLFTTCSAMLLDNVWVSYKQNAPYQDKFDLKLGEATGSFYQENGIFIRKFQRGTVFVDPSKEKAWVE